MGEAPVTFLEGWQQCCREKLICKLRLSVLTLVRHVMRDDASSGVQFARCVLQHSPPAFSTFQSIVCLKDSRSDIVCRSWNASQTGGRDTSLNQAANLISLLPSYVNTLKPSTIYGSIGTPNLPLPNVSYEDTSYVAIVTTILPTLLSNFSASADSIWMRARTRTRVRALMGLDQRSNGLW
jgi:hypothetical protein